jgi:hypothetical protein
MSKQKPSFDAPGVDVYSQGFLVSAKANELMSRLERTYKKLVGIEQADTDAGTSAQNSLPPGLDNVAAQLVNASLLRSSSKVVKRRARPPAPAPCNIDYPYHHEHMCRMFRC